VVQTSMRALPVVVVQPARKMLGPLLRIEVSACAQGDMEEAFNLAIGTRGVRTSEAVTNAEAS